MHLIYTRPKSLVRANCFSLLLFLPLLPRESKRCKNRLDAAESTGVCYLSPPLHTSLHFSLLHSFFLFHLLSQLVASFLYSLDRVKYSERIIRLKWTSINNEEGCIITKRKIYYEHKIVSFFNKKKIKIMH